MALGGEAVLVDEGGQQVAKTPRGSVLAVITADDRSWAATLQPQPRD